MKDFDDYKKKQYRQKAIYAAFYTVLGTLLPLILGSIILLAYSSSAKIVGFIDRGDFCLYSAGLLSSSFFLLSDNHEKLRKWHNSILVPVCFVLIIIAAGLYCSIFIGTDLLKEQIKLTMSNSFIRITSFILIAFSLIITYRSLIIDYKNRPPKVDVLKKEDEQVQTIISQLGN
jgi:hypothetical protein